MANQQQPDDSAAGSASLSPTGAARRRFTRAGAAASGVLLTLHSHPAMATVACTTASGFTSGVATSITSRIAQCGGLSPGYWRNHPEAWPSFGCNKSQPYCGIFLYGPRLNRSYSTISQMGILTPQSFDQSGIGRHMMAAYLNVLTKKSPYPTLEQLNKIWVEYRDFGYYTPTAGIKWNAAKIVAYLQSTIPA